MLPGRPVAMMMFKVRLSPASRQANVCLLDNHQTWGYIAMYQALQFVSDFKLGHYMKVPPRPMFWGQIVASVLAGTVQLGVQAWMFSNIDGMCSTHQKDG
jgi:uncharacterized paraquat-inducible protein A